MALRYTEQTTVIGDGCNVLVPHTELSARIDVKAKQRLRGEFSGKQPVVWLDDDEWEFGDRVDSSAEQGLLSSFNVNFE